MVATPSPGMSPSLPEKASPIPPSTLGVFWPSPALALYVVADGRPCAVHVVVKRGQRKEDDRLTLRVFDPDERLTLWQYVESEKPEGTASLERGEIVGMPAKITAATTESHDLLADFDVHLDAAGTHQIRVAAGACNSTVAVELPRPLPFGVSFQNGNFRPWDNKAGNGVDVTLDRPRELKICRSGMLCGDIQVNRVEVGLPGAVKKGETIELSYRLSPRRAAKKN